MQREFQTELLLCSEEYVYKKVNAFHFNKQPSHGAENGSCRSCAKTARGKNLTDNILGQEKDDKRSS